jgi:capsular exopolysaccharide synthesis family protein
MGKVYEALERAQREEQQRAATAAALRFSGSRNPAAVKTQEVEAQEPDSPFDFIDYSLRALPAEELAERHHLEASAAMARRSMVEPGKQLSLDLSRIDPHLSVFFDAGAQTSEQYNRLAISLISEREERRLKKIFVASTQRAEGRSCVTLNLACALGRARQRVLVIDADLHRPSLLRLLGIEAESGLTDVIRQNLPPGQATLKLVSHGFDLLPTREQVDNPAGILTAARFREVLALLEAEYDFILFDSSPLLQANEANLLVRMTDATVYVIRAGKTSSTQLGKAVGALTQDHLFGVVLNRTDSRSSKAHG